MLTPLEATSYSVPLAVELTSMAQKYEVKDNEHQMDPNGIQPQGEAIQEKPVSQDDTEAAWILFATLIDRIFFILHIIITLASLVFFLAKEA